jgi:crossover junction endodeoxyribonuclease RuvC
VRVLGIDCGTEFTGYGLIEDQQNSTELRCLTCGTIALSRREPMPQRLARVFGQLCSVLEHNRPDVVAIEDVFYAVNVKSVLKLGQVRGVAMLAAAVHGCPVAEYSPLAIKSAVAGYGKAEKIQVQHMVTRLLRLPNPPDSFDAADALAVAICHLHTATTQQRFHTAAAAGR